MTRFLRLKSETLTNISYRRGANGAEKILLKNA